MGTETDRTLQFLLPNRTASIIDIIYRINRSYPVLRTLFLLMLSNEGMDFCHQLLLTVFLLKKPLNTTTFKPFFEYGREIFGTEGRFRKDLLARTKGIKAIKHL